MEATSVRRTRVVSSRKKTGCTTCKKRRVRCDEGKPACQRCQTSSRICDGYGIWGGGSVYGNAERVSASGPDRARSPSPVSSVSDITAHLSLLPGITCAEQEDAFIFYHQYTILKLPGVFQSEFWDSLVSQACFQEPSVLHAIVALGAAHRRNNCLALQEYNKSISYLYPHLQSHGRYALRVALINCLMFVCLEILKGDIKTGIMHLRNGLLLLRKIQSRHQVGAVNGAVVLRPEPQAVEDHIAEAFSRMNVASGLLYYDSPFIYQVGEEAQGEIAYDIPAVFSNGRDARMYLDTLLNSIYSLSKRAFQLCYENKPLPHTLYSQKRRLNYALRQWGVTFDASRLIMAANARTKMGMLVLPMYHTMATIMVATCLRGTDEMVYDSHESDFALLIQQTEELWKRVIVVRYGKSECVVFMPEASVTADIGCIPPLYYTALKCREPRLRREAIRYIKEAPHREGVWDVDMTVRVVEYIVGVEEGRVPSELSTPLDDASGAARSNTAVPSDMRVNDVHVCAPDAVGEKFAIQYKRHREEDGNDVWNNETVTFDGGGTRG